MNARTVDGDYFDGVHAKSHRVQLWIEGDALNLSGGDINRHEKLATLNLSEPLGATARTFSFSDGATVLVRDVGSLELMLAATPLASTLTDRAHKKKGWVFAAFAAFVGAVALGYSIGLPWATRQIAHTLSPKVLDAIGAGAIGVFDQAGFAPSKLPEARRAEITRSFSALKPPFGNAKAKQILFRSSPEHGPNAVALPDGTMVVTDELVAIAQNDQQIMGVLSHELGHVHYRHGAQNVISGAIIAGFLGAYLGDFSTVVTGAAATLAASHYSRDAEREADNYAIAMMQANAIPPRALAALLARMDHAYRAKKKAGEADQRNFEDYFSSHPGTAERIAHIEGSEKK